MVFFFFSRLIHFTLWLLFGSFVRLPIRNKSIENVESTEVLLRQAGDGSVVCLCVVSVYCENWMKFVFSFVCACTVTQRNIRAKTESHQYKIING